MHTFDAGADLLRPMSRSIVAFSLLAPTVVGAQPSRDDVLRDREQQRERSQADRASAAMPVLRVADARQRDVVPTAESPCFVLSKKKDFVLEQIENVWDTGQTSDHFLTGDQIVSFKARTGSSRVVGFRWHHEGQLHEIGSLGVVLPDRSGLASTFGDGAIARNCLQVLNADGTERFRLWPPFLSARLDESDARLYLPGPGWPSSGIAFGVPGAYVDRIATNKDRKGWAPVFLDIDWQTGALKNWLGQPPGY